MTYLNRVLISFVLEAPNHMGAIPIDVKIEASRMDGICLKEMQR